MIYKDRNNVVSIITSLIVNFYIVFRLFDMNEAGLFAGPDAVNIWARMVIWVIPISIGLTIVGTILFNIGYAIVTGNPKPGFLVDERDQLFERRSSIAVIICAGGGFMLAVVGLAFGWSAFIGFNIIYFAMALGSLSADTIKFISYRRGY